MKRITLIFFTFLGIYSGFAQNTPIAVDTAIADQKIQLITQSVETGMAIVNDKPLVQVFPNPAKNKVELEIKGFEPGYLRVSLLNNSGKPVKEEKRLLLSGSETVVLMFSQDPGLYYLLLKQGAKTVRTKLIIQ